MMTLQLNDQLKEAAQALLEAEETKKSLQPLTDDIQQLSVDEAYQIQMENIDVKLAQGEKIVGKKIGLTSLAMQKALGVDQPDYGHLLSSMDVTMQKSDIPMDQLFEPKIEGEIAFVLKHDLRGPNVTEADVVAATDFIIPALEIVDSRIENWRIKLEDTIADNASSAQFVLGEGRYAVDSVKLKEMEMKLYKNNKLINKGYGADVLGNPITCVAWLANKLSDYGVHLKAGEVILSGALSAAIPVEKGDSFKAEFSGLESVEVSF